MTEPRSRGGRGSLVVAWLVAAAGGLNVLHAVLPGDDEGLLRSLTPDAVGPLARAAAVLTGIALLLAARGLARRRRRAWVVAVSVAALSTALHVLHGLNGGTLASAVVLLALVARRHDFDGPGDVATRRVTLLRAAAAAVAILGYGAAALWVNRMVADQPFTPGFALREIAAGLFGLNIRGSHHLAGAFGDWFPLSLLLLGVAATAWVIAGWLAPWRYRVRQEALDRQLADELVSTWGADTLAPFVLRADKSYFFGKERCSFLAYRVVGVRRDRLGRPDRARGRPRRARSPRSSPSRTAATGASRSSARPSSASSCTGATACTRSTTATRRSSTRPRSRSKAARSARCGSRTTGSSTPATSCASCARASSAPSCARELQAIADVWRGTQPERGFVMALDTLFALGDDHAVFAVGFGPDGQAGGFLHFAVSRAGGALSLSSMPRLRTTPNGFNEWLICGAIEWAREAGYERVSLNFAPFAALLTPEARALAGRRRCSAGRCCG